MAPAAPLPAAGLGFKPQYFDAACAARATGLWFEVHPENYLCAGGPRKAMLEALRAQHPLALHSVSLSLAGAAPPDPLALQRLAELVRSIEPVLVSEHLAWSSWGAEVLPDLLPMPRSSAALVRIAAHIGRTQDQLGRSIAIENPAHYLHLSGHDWSEIDFLAELVRRTGCTLLLDINNVLVAANNLGFDAAQYIDAFPAQAVSEVHLAGHSVDATHGAALLIDSHDAPVAPAVWALYRRFIARAGARPTLIERDDQLPPFAELMAERAMAANILAASARPVVAANAAVSA